MTAMTMTVEQDWRVTARELEVVIWGRVIRPGREGSLGGTVWRVVRAMVRQDAPGWSRHVPITPQWTRADWLTALRGGEFDRIYMLGPARLRELERWLADRT